MKICEASQNAKEFKVFLGQIITVNCMDYIFDLQSVYDLDNFDDFIIIKDGNKIVDFANVYSHNGLDFIAPNFTSYKRQLEELHLLKYTYPNHILECSDCYLNPEQKEYYKCKFNSRINRNYIYLTEDNTNFYVTNKQKTNVLRDKFEAEYFKKINMNNLQFVNIKCNQLADFLKKYELYDIPQWSNGTSSSITGFHYLSLEDAFGEDSELCEYLLCINKGTIIGAIKHGVFNTYNIQHQCMCYIDVNFANRRRGISKILMNKMNDFLIPNLPFVITDETEMGQRCHMTQLFKENINVPVYTYKELENLQFEKQIKDIKNR